MVRILFISIFLIPIVTILGSEFWSDVDEKFNELSDPEDSSTQATLNNLSGPQDLPTQAPLYYVSNPEELSTQATTSQAQKVELLYEGPHSYNEVHIRTPPRRTYHRQVCYSREEMVPFTQAITIDQWYPKNLTETVIIDKLLELGYFHEWPLLRLYDVEDYSKYWAYVCTFFAEVNFTSMPRVSCRLSPTFGLAKQRLTEHRGRNQVLDLLGCNCYGYQGNIRNPGTSNEKFLIHQRSATEFFKFEPKKISKHIRLIVKNFRGGVTLPCPTDIIGLNL